MVVGLTPFVVYRIVAPLSTVVISTDTWPSYVPAAGETVGAVSVPKFIVYVAVRTSEGLQPLLKPAAFTVVVVLTAMALAYGVEDAVGSLPSSV